MVFLTSFMVVQMHFRSKRTLAAGLSVIGGPIASFMWPPITSTLVAQFSWRGALFIYSAVTLNGFACALMMAVGERPSSGDLKTINLKQYTQNESVKLSATVDFHSQSKKTQDIDKSQTRKDITTPNITANKEDQKSRLAFLLEPAWIVYQVTSVLFGFGNSTPRLMLPSRAVHELDFSRLHASLLLSLFAFIDIVAIIMTGALTRSGPIRAVLFTLAPSLCGVVNCMAPLFITDWSLVLHTAMFGVTHGNLIVL